MLEQWKAMDAFLSRIIERQRNSRNSENHLAPDSKFATRTERRGNLIYVYNREKLVAVRRA